MSGSTGGDVVVRGRVVTSGGVLADGYVAVRSGRVEAVGPCAEHPQPETLPAAAGTILPGLVDLHCHGGGGASVAAGSVEQAEHVVRHHRAAGTTSLVLSTVTDSTEAMLASVESAAEAVRRGHGRAVHLEGPFLAAARCGAQDPRHLRDPDPGLLRELVAAGSGAVRIMTVAPELSGAAALLRSLPELGVVGAVGHTDADAALVTDALSVPGVDLVTHLFNGMPPLHHRAPGPVAACLSAAARGRARVELVADAVHLADATVRMVFDLLGPERVVLVTDAMAAAGMPDGEYVLGPRRVTVHGGVARLPGPDGAIAGGTSSLLDVVRRCVRHAGVPLEAAVASASATPADVLGLTDGTGHLRAGSPADLVVVDAELSLVAVMRAGRWVSGGPTPQVVQGTSGDR